MVTYSIVARDPETGQLGVAVQSRAFAGLSNATFVFCLPGSTSACRTAWEKLIRAQLDARTKPCNLVALRPRLRDR